MVGKKHPIASRIWKAGRFEFDLQERGLIMGIINATPDSFSDGGSYLAPEQAVERALEQVRQGADVIDVGGESTRPGADVVSADVEAARVIPVIEGIRERCENVAISVDTSKASVAAAAIEAGADIVNDISGLRGDPNMLATLAPTDAGLILMHMQGEPRTMQHSPEYEDVVVEVADFYLEQLELAGTAGLERERIVLDPGIGFGKTLDHNLQLLRAIPDHLDQVGRPILIGVSRKSLFAGLIGADSMADRLWPTVAMTSYCRQLGAGVLRVHDVEENAHAMKMTEAILRAGCAPKSC